jgi:hypothetical protein
VREREDWASDDTLGILKASRTAGICMVKFCATPYTLDAAQNKQSADGTCVPIHTMVRLSARSVVVILDAVS